MATTPAFNTFEQTTLSFNPFKNLGETIEYGALANSCGFGTIRKGESSFACILASYIEQQEEIKRLRKENEELKSQRPKYTCPQDECLIGDATFDYYYAANEDGDMTIWKVPRHLAEVKSTQTSSHGAVEQAFYDEKFGETYGKLTYLIVREMKEADLVKRKIQLKKEVEKYTDCDECGRFCYTGGDEYPDGYVCADCDEDAENSEDDE